ncbi:MAG: hypothetical protein AAF672_09390 [Pseudomonadota bacterium]
MTKRDDISELDLDALFAEAKAAPAPSSEQLQARIIADAAALQPQSAPVLAGPARRRPLATLLDAIGGWPAIGGLVTAAAAGVYIGFAQPDLLAAPEQAIADPGFTVSGFLPGDDMFFEEG